MTDKYNDEIIEEENQDTDDQTDDYEPEKFCTLCHRSDRFEQLPEPDGTAAKTKEEKK